MICCFSNRCRFGNCFRLDNYGRFTAKRSSEDEHGSGCVLGPKTALLFPCFGSWI